MATARTLDSLNAALRRLVDETLARRREHATAGFVAYLRTLDLTHDDYDRLAHYVLTAALAHRVGPERLILIGAGLVTIRAAVVLLPDVPSR